jgi:hypothetical protein
LFQISEVAFDTIKHLFTGYSDNNKSGREIFDVLGENKVLLTSKYAYTVERILLLLYNNLPFLSRDIFLMTNWIIIVKATVTTIQPAATPPIRDAEHDSQIG